MCLSLLHSILSPPCSHPPLSPLSTPSITACGHEIFYRCELADLVRLGLWVCVREEGVCTDGPWDLSVSHCVKQRCWHCAILSSHAPPPPSLLFSCQREMWVISLTLRDKTFQYMVQYKNIKFGWLCLDALHYSVQEPIGLTDKPFGDLTSLLFMLCISLCSMQVGVFAF